MGVSVSLLSPTPNPNKSNTTRIALAIIAPKSTNNSHQAFGSQEKTARSTDHPRIFSAAVWGSLQDARGREEVPGASAHLAPVLTDPRGSRGARLGHRKGKPKPRDSTETGSQGSETKIWLAKPKAIWSGNGPVVSMVENN